MIKYLLVSSQLNFNETKKNYFDGKNKLKERKKIKIKK